MRILYVEDHPDSREAFVEILEADGHRVVPASSLTEARALAAACYGAGGTGLDLVICDIGLPDGNGNDLMRELTERYPLLGIALTGYSLDIDRTSEKAGFTLYLIKPVHPARLRDASDSLRAR